MDAWIPVPAWCDDAPKTGRGSNLKPFEKPAILHVRLPKPARDGNRRLTVLQDIPMLSFGGEVIASQA